eukprot:13044202-Ditylum_brightwellii.AAC.1
MQTAPKEGESHVKMIDGKVLYWCGICTCWDYTHLTKKEGNIPGHICSYKESTNIPTSPKSETVLVLTALDQIKLEDEKAPGKNVSPGIQHQISWAQAMMHGLEE